jgi:hypothetical protein
MVWKACPVFCIKATGRSWSGLFSCQSGEAAKLKFQGIAAVAVVRLWAFPSQFRKIIRT